MTRREITGLPGHDRITLGDEDATIAAGEGNNQIIAGDGDLTITAGKGKDTVRFGDGYVIVTIAGGDTSLRGGNGSNQITTGDGRDSLQLGDGDNVIDAGAGANRIRVGDGDNLISSGDDADQITGGDGDNTIDAGGGANRIKLGRGTNSITVGDGNNDIRTLGGTATILAGDGRNRITLGDGDSEVTVGDGGNTIRLGDGNQVVRAGDGRNAITAGDGTHDIATGSGDDRISLGDGDSQVDSGAGNDSIRIGDGNHVVQASGGRNVITLGDGSHSVSTGAGDDRITLGEGTASISAGSGRNRIKAGDGDVFVETGSDADDIRLGDGDHEIWSVGGNNKIRAGDGDIHVTLGDGNDQVSLGDGTAIIEAGAGRNRIDTGLGEAYITSGDGDDGIITRGTISEIDAGNGRNAIQSADGSVKIRTGTGDDTIRLGDGTVELFDRGGSNRITGGSGTVQITTSDGRDDLRFKHVTGSIDLGSGDKRVTAGNGDLVIDSVGERNSIRLGDGQNELRFEDGAVTAQLGDGDNQLNMGDGGGRLSFGDGDNFVSTGRGKDSIRAGDGQNIVLTGAGDDRVTVGDGGNKVNLGDGNDRLRSGNGNDVIWVGGGVDNVNAGRGYDVVHYSGDMSDYVINRSSSRVEVRSADGAVDRLTGVEALYFDGEDRLLDLTVPADAALADDAVEATGEGPLEIAAAVLLANDQGIDAAGIQVATTSAAGIAVQFDGSTITYNADDVLRYLVEGEEFRDSFTYTAPSVSGAGRTARVSVTLTGQNDAPTVVADQITGPGGADVAVDAVITVNDAGAWGEQWPAMTALGDGRFVVAWSAGATKSDYAIRARILEADGSAAGDVFQVSEQAPTGTPRTSVIALDDGALLFVWRQRAETDTLNARILNADGTARTPEFAIDHQGAIEIGAPHVTALADGGFALAWQYQNPSTYDWNIKAAFFDANGEKTSRDFTVNKVTESTQQKIDVDARPDGGVVAVWYSYAGSSTGSEIKARVFDGDGRVVVDEFQVNTTTAGLQSYPTVEVRDDGGFAVAWYTQEDGYDRKLRLFNADGTPASDEIQLNSAELRAGGDAAMAWLDTGQLVVGWRQYRSDDIRNIDPRIHVRLFNPDGGEAVAEHVVPGSYWQSNPQISALPGGRYVITYSADAQHGGPVQSQIFSAGGEARAATDEDTAITLDVAQFLANDSDPEGDALSFDLAGDTSELGASLHYDADTGTLHYDPSAAVHLQVLGEGQIRTDRITYRVTDSHGASSDGTISLSVSGIEDDAPLVAMDDRFESGGLLENTHYTPGAELRLNESGGRWHKAPATVGLVGGGAVVAWRVNGGDEDGVHVRVLDSDGTTVVSEFAVTDYPAGQMYPAVSALPSGGFAVSWSEWIGPITDNLRPAIVRLFDADGTPQTEPLHMPVGLSAHQNIQAMTTLANGDLAFIWDARDVHDNRLGAELVVLDSQGQPRSAPLVLGEGYKAYAPDLIALPDGGFLVTWCENGSPDPDGSGVLAQLFDDAGQPSGPAELVNLETDASQCAPSVAVQPDGTVAILWQTRDTAAKQSSLEVRIMGSDTQSQITQSTHVVSGGLGGRIEALPDGKFLVVWNDYQGGDTPYYMDVFARVLNADGTPAGDRFLVNTHTAEHQLWPEIAVLDEDRFLITWESMDGTRTSNENISARVFTLTGDLVEEYFTDEDHAVRIDIDQVLANDVAADVDGLILSLAQQSSALGAELRYDADRAQLVYDPTGAEQLQALNAGDVVEDHFDYVITDAEGQTSDATIKLLIGGVDELVFA